MAKLNTTPVLVKKSLNITLIKQVITARLANKRQGTSHVKTRSEVRGGGRKPWKQKGTGRARAGSIRSPIWAGGGITFGPDKNKNYKQHLPKKMSKKAIVDLLNYLKTKKRLIVVKSLSLKEAKTKAALKLLGEYNILGKRTTLVTENVEPELVFATRNLTGVNTITAVDLSILDISSGYVLIEEKAAQRLGIKPISINSLRKTVKKSDENINEGKSK